jgi:hypothetical protein
MILICAGAGILTGALSATSGEVSSGALVGVIIGAALAGPAGAFAGGAAAAGVETVLSGLLRTWHDGVVRGLLGVVVLGVAALVVGFIRLYAWLGGYWWGRQTRKELQRRMKEELGRQSKY